jgi:hypothetical protein
MPTDAALAGANPAALPVRRIDELRDLIRDAYRMASPGAPRRAYLRRYGFEGDALEVALIGLEVLDDILADLQERLARTLESRP